jgi:hypothetical protein
MPAALGAPWILEHETYLKKRMPIQVTLRLQKFHDLLEASTTSGWPRNSSH